MFGVAPPIPWGLVAAAVITVTLAGSGWYVIHEMRKGDAAEIRALAETTRINAAAAQRESAARLAYAANAKKAAQEQAQAHERTEDALRALQEQWDALPTDDPCRLCSLDWPVDGLHED